MKVSRFTTRTYAVDYFLGDSIDGRRERTPLLTVYNPRTREHEQIPLPEFQRLLRQGQIEESVSQSPYDGHPQRTYRLI